MTPTLVRHGAWIAYWTIVFDGVAWLVHETWPWGLAAVPLAVVHVWAQREFVKRHPEARP